MELVSYRDGLTDIEIAMHLLRLMGDNGNQHEFKKAQRSSNVKHTYITMAENAAKTMTNPFAKKLLMNKIAVQNI